MPAEHSVVGGGPRNLDCQGKKRGSERGTRRLAHHVPPAHALLRLL
ncbi:hypothetical protein [Streptomyces sp. CoH27]|nr:hypothetical protein [Streptomyces sp. CoH27]